MSPTAIARRLIEHRSIQQQYSSGEPRVQRIPLQLMRAPVPRSEVHTPESTPRIPSVPPEVIAEVCDSVVNRQASASHEVPQEKPSRNPTPSFRPFQRSNQKSSGINLPPGWSNPQQSTSTWPLSTQHVMPQQTTSHRETQQQESLYEEASGNTSPQPTIDMSSGSTRQVRLPTPVSTPTPQTVAEMPNRASTSRMSDVTEPISIEPVLNRSQTRRVSQWAEEQRRTVSVHNQQSEQEMSTLDDTPRRNTTRSAASMSMSDCVYVDSERSSPVTVFFAREPLERTIPRRDPRKYSEAVQWMDQNYPTFVTPLAKRPKPKSENIKTIKLMGAYATLVDEYLLALAEDMRQAGVKDINHFPPVKPQGASRGAFTLQEPVLQITAQKFPDPDTTPWCVKNPCPSLVSTMSHRELSNIEERMAFAIHSANAAMYFLTASRDKNSTTKTRKVKTRAATVLGKAHHALHAVYAGVIAVRRRDVIDPILAVKKQIDIIQQPVTGTRTLVDY